MLYESIQESEQTTAFILCSDRRFARWIEFCCMDCGLSPTVANPIDFTISDTPSTSDEWIGLIRKHRARLLLGDADEYPALMKLPSDFPAVIWSRNFSLQSDTQGKPIHLRRPIDSDMLKSAISICMGPDTFPNAVTPPASLSLSASVTPDSHILLTPNEKILLNYLTAHRGQAVSRTLLLTLIRKESDDNSEQSNMVDVYIARLRRKLETPSGARLIQSVRGVGYKMI